MRPDGSNWSGWLHRQITKESATQEGKSGFLQRLLSRRKVEHHDPVVIEPMDGAQKHKNGDNPKYLGTLKTSDSQLFRVEGVEPI
ncbi:MAG: hypothetical protein ACT4O4_12365 [Nitrospiraceae bacterium]